METKTKIGLSTTVVAAVICLVALFDSYTALLLLVGYVLICESDAWLRQTAVGVLVICLLFSVINAVLGLIPDVIGILNNLLAIFGKGFSIPFVSKVITFLRSILSFLERIVLLALGIFSLTGKKISVPAVEKFVGKYLSHPDKG